MNTWMTNAAFGLVFVLAATGIFFFVATRGALIVRGLSRAPRSSESHVYPIYSNMRLIKMVDFQPIISAILLFQYHRLVSKIVAGLARHQPEAQEGADHFVCLRQRDPPRGGSVARIGRRAHRDRRHHPERADARQEQACAMHARKIEYIEDDATGMTQKEGFADANVMFFLLHELPHDLKSKALSEAGRMLAPGGKLYLGEFHKPDARGSCVA